MHVSWKEIEDAAKETGRAIIELDEGDTADSMVSTNWDFIGPGVILYHVYPDGGVDVHPDDRVGRHYRG